MKHYIKSLYILLLMVLAIAAGGVLQGCRDDAFDDYNVQYPDGETIVKLNLDFEPISSARLASRATNAPDGDVVKDLRDFSVLMYDTRYADNGSSGRLTYVKHFSQDDIAGMANGITLVDKDRERVDANASTGQKAESRTMHVEAVLKDVPYGPYKVFAVANLGVNGSTTKDVLEAEGVDIDTPEGLLAIKAVWDKTNMQNNAQMTGYFSEGEQQPSPGTGSKVDEVHIKSGGMTLHSWLRRLVGKITVTYDPSGLRKGITVTIKKVTVRDIASSCYLGMPNRIGPVDGEGALNTDGLLDPYNNYDTDLGNDEWNHCIEYDTPIVLTSDTKDGSEYLQLDNNFNIPAHSETAKALYFFENMQGEVKDKDLNGKLQDENGDGIIDYPNANKEDHEDYKDYKDGLKYGTYVEVEAEYDARIISHREGHGTIKYRFMIGKNVTTNCDAERNHHYKLKLRFMGNANEVDWHVDYDEDPGFYGPNPYYVSYLYNRMTYYPLKISGELDENYGVNLTIIQNAWWPNNAVGYKYFASTDKDASGKKLKNDEGQDSVGIDLTKIYHPNNDKTSLEPWTGFLSLSQNMDHQNTNVALGLDILLYGSIVNGDYLYKYWIGENQTIAGSNFTAQDTKQNRGVRTYKVNAAADPDNNREKGTYSVTRDANSTTFNVPFFTREKQIQKTTAYTGNNPYLSYEREAKVLLRYKLKGESEPRKDTIKVYQVRRIVNPKGVWRKHNNPKPFHVNLKYQKTEFSNQFLPIKSIGPWRAYISRGNTSFITLDGKTEVRGGDGTEIDFNIAFRGAIPASENRCAVIRVEYNNYSCHHLIFVRQGSAPILMNANSTVKWHLSNITTTSGIGSNVVVNEGESPLDEGSLFRYGNLEKGIASKSNPMYENEKRGVPLEPGDFDTGNDPTLALLSNGSKNQKWSSITSVHSSGEFADVKIAGKGDKYYSVASIDDYKTIIPDGEHNEEIEFGYGVLYGNDAATTATTLESAYGFDASDSESLERTKTYGMRGVFVYNSSTDVTLLGGNHVFFPIGRCGYGRRRAKIGWAQPKSEGALHYASRADYYDENTAKALPLFYDIFRSNGALYWVKKIYSVNGEEKEAVVDLNYRTLDFNIANQGISGSTSDACFVRLVER